MDFRKGRKGVALIISVIFVLIFSALAVSMATITGTNVQIAENQRRADCTRACAESGLEIIRFWLSRVSVDGTTMSSFVFGEINASLQTDLTANGISNITPNYEDSVITIPSVTLNSTNEQSFYTSITPKPTVVDPNALQVNVTGTYGSLAKTISVNYDFGTREHTVFDYGVATRGPLHLSGNIELTGEKLTLDASVYIESENETSLSIIGNSQIAGDVNITNSSPAADIVDLQGGQASIGGETAPEAYDHVFTGTPPAEFPVPDPSYFEHYVVEDINYPSAETTFENVRIPANTNPDFSGNVTLRGIVFIETPNIVTFSGNTIITGIIVGDGDLEDNSGTNQINFLGGVDSYPVSELPEETQFEEIRNETGTFLMAPGFSVSFGGNFSTLSGAIAANGIEFFGDAGGTINGSVINYSDTPMTLSGTNHLYFKRLEEGVVPAGFVPEIVLHYDPASYCENLL